MNNMAIQAYYIDLDKTALAKKKKYNYANANSIFRAQRQQFCYFSTFHMPISQ